MSVKQAIKKLLPGLIGFRNRLYNHLVHYRFKHLPVDEVFELIYKENHWRDVESPSGTGSNLKNTESVIRIVNSALGEYNIRSMIDIPCGDFNWMKTVNLNAVEYLGADIVADLVVKNNEQYQSERVRFEKLNILESTMPTVDLVFCRDCLVHLSYKDIAKAIQTVKKSSSKYLMTTTFPSHNNYDIITGDWRPINLELKPFYFPPPINIYNELCAEDERYSDKSLAVWRIADL